ncbi:MAG TPA: zinc dependent phospholipase C family protein [Longimicrobiaceae bacterium]|nr:zinc dependent phospholipase C family protein [Longimicrobiaceae bacterium]
MGKRAPLALGVAVLLVFLLPHPAWAWGPATHVYLGTGVLSSLQLLPVAVRQLLMSYPYEFLYGSVAADISLAKKYVPVGRHCHHWHVGEEIHGQAESDRLRAVGLGYLAHLAADTVAHNFYVPRQLLLTSSTKALGHSYWEHRMDVQLGEKYTSLARAVVMDHDHSAADALFDRVLSGTLFSFHTNRRIFRGMIRFQDNDRWQSIFGTILENSRWTLSEETIEAYAERSFDYVIDYLARRGDAIAASLDPIGEVNLDLAKKVRRLALSDGAWEKPHLLQEMADEFFPLPEVPFGFWKTRGTDRTH